MPALRRPRPVVARSVRRLVLLLTSALLVAACQAEELPFPAPPPSPDAALPVVGGGLVIVLPPADRLAEEERDHVRRSVERALAAVLLVDDDTGGVDVLEPADTDAVSDAVERAVRFVGPGGTVCVVGTAVRARIDPVLALYPATRLCRLPEPLTEGQDAGNVRLALDVALGDLGREIGAAAVAAAGSGTVLLLDAGDPMLDRRWRDGVASGVLDRDRVGGPGRFHVVGSAEALLDLLDTQAALLADGVVPGGAEARAEHDRAGADDVPALDDAGLPPEVFLPPVTVVVLDATPESARVLTELAGRDLLLVGPRSLMATEDVDQRSVVLRWHVDWHLPIAALLDAVISEDDAPARIGEDPVVVVPGPAAAG